MTRLTLKGDKSLKALFPANTWVPITLTNPEDGLTILVKYNLTQNAFRLPQPAFSAGALRGRVCPRGDKEEGSGLNVRSIRERRPASRRRFERRERA